MLNLDLMINYCRIHLGEEINQNMIQEAKLKKLGIWGGIFLKKPKGTVIYLAKNCHISSLNLQIALIPQLKPSDGPFMFATSAFLYTAGGKIYKIVYQLLDNKDIAISEYNFFAKTCSNIYGEPKMQHDKLCIWEDKQSSIISELGNNPKNYFVYWILIDPTILFRE